jgi:uncharacterized SAM-binding protein YcdF (DUF218 family)
MIPGRGDTVCLYAAAIGDTLGRMDGRVRTMTGPGAAGGADPRGWKPSLWTQPGSRRLGLPGACRAAVLAAAAVTTLAVGGFLAFVASLDRFEQFPQGRSDGIVALTGGSQRIGDAIDLLARGYARRLLITGVNEHTSRSEIARLNPGQRRLFDCCVDLDYRARNTIGNAAETRRWAEVNKFRSLIVVTSNYHMPRTLIELDRALPDIRKAPYSVVTSATSGAWWRNPGAARLLVSEYAKFVAAWLRIRLDREPEPGVGVARLIETRR